MLWFAPDLARACACCGHERSMSVAGWSADGSQVAIHVRDDDTCFVNETYEIWTVGADAPDYCLGGYTPDSAAPIPCKDATGTDPNAPLPDSLGELALPDGFDPHAPTLSADQLLVWGWRTRVDDAQAEDDYILQMRVRAGDRFRSITPRNYEPSDEPGMAPSSISVWPAPRGRRSVMFVQSYAHGDGEEIEMRMFRIDLPRGIERAAASRVPAWFVPMHPPTRPVDGVEPRAVAAAARTLARARVYERAGRVADALEHVERATQLDPRVRGSWIELGRLLTLQGHHGRALGVLLRLGPASTPAEEAALSDPAFEPLRPALRAREVVR